MMEGLTITSFNCQGFKSSEDFVAELFKKTDILAIQEHWLNPMDFHVLSSVAEDVVYCAKSPMEKDYLLTGRPFGGVGLMWHKKHQQIIFPVQTASDRIVAVKMMSEAGVILIIAVYMPVECGSVVNREEYISELGVVEGLLEIDDHDQVVLMGDFNADIRRSDRRFARFLNSFLICHNLTAVGLEDASATTAQNTWHIVMTLGVSLGLIIYVSPSL